MIYVPVSWYAPELTPLRGSSRHFAALVSFSDIWDGHPKDKIHNTLDRTSLDEIHRKCLVRAKAKPKPETTLLVLDDMAVFLKMKDVEAKLRELIFNRRHLRLSMMFLVQSFNALPLTLRKTLSHFALFRPRNKKEVEAVFEEVMFINRKTAAALLKFTFRDDHDFLFGNTNTGQFYRNFNEIVISEEGDDYFAGSGSGGSGSKRARSPDPEKEEDHKPRDR